MNKTSIEITSIQYSELNGLCALIKGAALQADSGGSSDALWKIYELYDKFVGDLVKPAGITFGLIESEDNA